MSIGEQRNCFYLDSSDQPASTMLKKCVSDIHSPYEFNCGNNPMSQDKLNAVKNTARINDIAIQRGFVEYNIENLNSMNANSMNPNLFKHNPVENYSGVEGFTNNIFPVDNGPGKSSLQSGECPEGFSLNSGGMCIQKCQSCVYNDTMKSLEFNEKDPCFPDGVYDGITNEGFIKCTCGSSNQYCSDNFIKNLFTTDGLMITKNQIVLNTGLPNMIDNLFNFETL